MVSYSPKSNSPTHGFVFVTSGCFCDIVLMCLSKLQTISDILSLMLIMFTNVPNHDTSILTER